jgi:hypothetical protein
MNQQSSDNQEPTSPRSPEFSEGNTKEHFQALLRASQLRLLIKQLAAATGASFSPRYLETEQTFTVYILWERGPQLYNTIEIRFDLDGTITIQDVSIPMYVWQDNRSPLEKALEQAYNNPKMHDADVSRSGSWSRLHDMPAMSEPSTKQTISFMRSCLAFTIAPILAFLAVGIMLIIGLVQYSYVTINATTMYYTHIPQLECRMTSQGLSQCRA